MVVRWWMVGAVTDCARLCLVAATCPTGRRPTEVPRSFSQLRALSSPIAFYSSSRFHADTRRERVCSAVCFFLVVERVGQVHILDSPERRDGTGIIYPAEREEGVGGITQSILMVWV